MILFSLSPLEVQSLTFLDIDKKEVKFFNENRPYFRLIHAHKHRSFIHAEKNGWINEAKLIEADNSQRASDEALLNASLDSGYIARMSLYQLHTHPTPAENSNPGKFLSSLNI
jgi:hypothetical protein